MVRRGAVAGVAAPQLLRGDVRVARPVAGVRLHHEGGAVGGAPVSRCLVMTSVPCIDDHHVSVHGLHPPLPERDPAAGGEE